jgi:hypothetical protein
LNLRPSGYEPDELPGCSTPRQLVRHGGCGPVQDRVVWPPRGLARACGAGLGRRHGERENMGVGLAATYSPASWDAVPSARRGLTAGFGMGPGVSLALWPPDLESPQQGLSRSGCRSQASGPRCLRRRLRPDRGPACSLKPVVCCTVRERPGGLGPGATELAFTGSDQANRRISTGRLSALPRVHPRPIDVVVCHAPHARPGFEGGFPLRCLQRLSCPDIATLQRGWRHDRSTSGPSTPVLSY